MTNQTPPAWIRNLTKELLSLVPGVHKSDFMYPAIRDNWNNIISEHAPDAEALAVALEQSIHYLADLNGCEWIKGDDAGSLDMKQRAKSQQSRANKALDAYRARFPKVTP